MLTSRHDFSLMHQAAVAQTPEGKLHAWVDETYTHVPLREKDTGTKLEVLYAAYTAAQPPGTRQGAGESPSLARCSTRSSRIRIKNSTRTANRLYLLR